MGMMATRKRVLTSTKLRRADLEEGELVEYGGAWGPHPGGWRAHKVDLASATRAPFPLWALCLSQPDLILFLSCCRLRIIVEETMRQCRVQAIFLFTFPFGSPDPYDRPSVTCNTPCTRIEIFSVFPSSLQDLQ
jgi:hypothetical protein